MDIEELKRRYPDIEVEEMFPDFPRYSLDGYPELEGYTWEQCHEGEMGPGTLFQAMDLARQAGLERGMRVLDLACGRALSSVFVARHYGVQVMAGDLNVGPAVNWDRVTRAGLEDLITPIKMDARDIPFPEGYFDAVLCVNAYQYFGTDDLYLPYLLKFLKPSGRICIGGLCFSGEITAATPREFIVEDEAYAWHSPDWWRDHFTRQSLVDVTHCAAHPKGREIWLDSIRWRIERRHPKEWDALFRDSILTEAVALMMDRERFITSFMLVGRRH
jgi:cyclopropane fatty-acyl-phospholipid synthase-like methyltransferase